MRSLTIFSLFAASLAWGDWTDYEGEKAYLRTWIEERTALFDADHPL